MSGNNFYRGRRWLGLAGRSCLDIWYSGEDELVCPTGEIWCEVKVLRKSMYPTSEVLVCRGEDNLVGEVVIGSYC